MKIKLILDWNNLLESIKSVKKFEIEDSSLSIHNNFFIDPEVIEKGYKLLFAVDVNDKNYLVHCTGTIADIVYSLTYDPLKPKDYNFLIIKLENVYPCDMFNPFKPLEVVSKDEN